MQSVMMRGEIRNDVEDLGRGDLIKISPGGVEYRVTDVFSADHDNIDRRINLHRLDGSESADLDAQIILLPDSRVRVRRSGPRGGRKWTETQRLTWIQSLPVGGLESMFVESEA